jgi:putative nucleotidyltransferase with HDIG domain
MLMLEGLEAGCPATLAMGVLLHDIGKPGTFERADDRIRFHGHVELGVEIAGRICRRLRYSNAETEQILALVKHHMRFAHVTEMKRSTLKRFLRMEGFDEHLELHRLDCESSHRNLGNYDFVRGELDALRAADAENSAGASADGARPDRARLRSGPAASSASSKPSRTPVWRSASPQATRRWRC